MLDMLPIIHDPFSSIRLDDGHRCSFGRQKLEKWLRGEDVSLDVQNFPMIIIHALHDECD